MKIPPHKRVKPEDVNMEPVYLTPAGIDELRRKLERLKARLPALAEETARTAAFGDRSDNAEYKAAKGALRFATYESYRIEDQLKRVVPIESGARADGSVQLGSVVTLQEVSDKKGGSSVEKIFEILGPQETNPTKGRISHLSPLGSALIGKKKGDTVSVKSDSGTKEYTIREVK